MATSDIRALLVVVSLLTTLAPSSAWLIQPRCLLPQHNTGKASLKSGVPHRLSLAVGVRGATVTRGRRATFATVLTASAGAEAAAGEAKVVVGGGCFWCTEAVFLEAEGVLRVVSGYAGGTKEKPSYREVVSGKTGHAECIQITFDPAQISLAQIFDLHMASHDPTQLNRQGVDVGTQYRSVILYSTEEQREEAVKAVARAQEERKGSKFLGLIPMPSEVVTQVEPLDTFWPAESYHQDYYSKNPYDRYSVVNIAPKLASSKVRAKLKDIRTAEDK